MRKLYRIPSNAKFDTFEQFLDAVPCAKKYACANYDHDGASDGPESTVPSAISLGIDKKLLTRIQGIDFIGEILEERSSGNGIFSWDLPSSSFQDNPYRPKFTRDLFTPLSCPMSNADFAQVFEVTKDSNLRIRSAFAVRQTVLDFS